MTNADSIRLIVCEAVGLWGQWYENRIVGETPMSTRWTEIAAIWKDNRWLYAVMGVLLGILIAPGIEQAIGDLNNLIGNLVPEAVGIVFTVLIVDRLADNRTKQEHKLSLFRQAKSWSNDAALEAVNQILHDDLWKELREHYLIKSWRGKERIDLSQIQWMGGIQLLEIDLRDADLFQADLEAARMQFSNLENARLENANLINVDLSESNLEDAQLAFANLKNVSLFQANLRGATGIKNTKFNETTLLPDARYWTPETDMTRYTNPDHPEFFEPDYLKSEYIGLRPSWVREQGAR